MYKQPEVFCKRLFKFSTFRDSLAGNGLFTCDDDEPIWGQASRILRPAFSLKGMQQYFEVCVVSAATLFAACLL